MDVFQKVIFIFLHGALLRRSKFVKFNHNLIYANFLSLLSMQKKKFILFSFVFFLCFFFNLKISIFFMPPSA